MNNIEAIITGIKEIGYNSYLVDSDTIICDFGLYNNFYYEKLKKNNINIEFSENNKLRIKVYKNIDSSSFLKLLEKKDMIIFDLDGVVFDVSESYMTTIQETYKYFSGKEVSLQEVLKVKSKSGMNCDWNVVEYLLQEKNIKADIEEIADVFQNIFYNPEVCKSDYFINKEKLLIPKESFEKISKRYDLVVFSGRLMYEVEYSLNRFEIDKYFYYYVTGDNKTPDMLKPSPSGVFEILKNCPYKTVKYIGDSIDDIKAGVCAGVDMIGVVPENKDFKEKSELFINCGAKYIIENVSEIDDFLKTTD